ncbi:putative pentatricopeptide repeat-containing protein At5g37570 [Magnolia sinica]|uniref:putative pentatricopeptide repeat-containing protein At5g37570 n=1 Tax=Magnolia sinica TaxID=86752 RepID=UPI002658A7B9|nr:putative pentatricopeptide repeat-containing protein At5g37570 [Magnolia sinica]
MQETSLSTPRSRHLKNKHHKNNKVDGAAFLLRQCKSLSPLKQIHAHIFRSNLHQNISLSSTLITLYASLSLPIFSHLIFSSISHPNLSLFNHAIRAFSKFPSLCLSSLHLYLQMTRNRIKPDNFTFPFLFNSCASLSSLPHGVEIHGRVLKTGFGSCIPVSNALIDMYGKCGGLDWSRQVFDEMPERDVVSYNAVLGAHAKLGVEMAEAQRLFNRMPARNVISWNAMIVGYVNGGDLDSARGVFDEMPERNVVSWTTMIVGYTKSGSVDVAKLLFDAMPERNLISWTAMITGYAQNGRPTEALELFRRMEMARMKPDAITMTGVISASAQLGGTELANFTSSYVNKNGIERNAKVLTALVDMHAKCGNMEEACRSFDEIPGPDVYSYSALITGLASHGHGIKALDIFNRMRAENVEPDNVTFIGVLNACSHTGLVDDGLRFWKSMVEIYGIQPGPDHYACMVDMLGRAGRLEEAHKLVKSMGTGPHCGALGALLAACKMHGNIEIAEAVAEQLFMLEPENTGNYMLLSSIYALKERWEDAARVRAVMKDRGVSKLPGCSWIEVNSKTTKVHYKSN